MRLRSTELDIISEHQRQSTLTSRTFATAENKPKNLNLFIRTSGGKLLLDKNSLPSAVVQSEAPVRGQVCGRGQPGGGGPGEAAAQPDVGGHQSHPIPPRGLAGGSHEGKPACIYS